MFSYATSTSHISMTRKHKVLTESKYPLYTLKKYYIGNDISARGFNAVR